jgi:hypothetical protein
MIPAISANAPNKFCIRWYSTCGVQVVPDGNTVWLSDKIFATENPSMRSEVGQLPSSHSMFFSCVNSRHMMQMPSRCRPDAVALDQNNPGEERRRLQESKLSQVVLQMQVRFQNCGGVSAHVPVLVSDFSSAKGSLYEVIRQELVIAR